MNSSSIQEENVVLVTAIGSMSAPCVLRELYSNIENIKIIGTDIYPIEWQTNLKHLEKFYKVPKYNESDYVDSILDICVSNKIRFIFSLTDVEIDVLNRHRNLFESNEIVICISSFETILCCRDKSKIGSNIPFFSLVELKNIDVYPIVAKPKNGRSSEGKFILENPAQLSIVKDPKEYIFQPYIDGQVVTVDIIRDKIGNTISVSRKELLRTSNGAGIVVEIFTDTNLEKIVLQKTDILNIVGCVNFEFLYSNGAYYLMDINPRFSAGIGFSCFAGYNFIVEHLNVFKDKNIPKMHKFETGIFAVKTNIMQLK